MSQFSPNFQNFFPKISVGVNNNFIDLNMQIYEQLNKALSSSAKIIILKDEYYNNFYDQELSLFFLFFKIYRGLYGIEHFSDLTEKNLKI